MPTTATEVAFARKENQQGNKWVGTTMYVTLPAWTRTDAPVVGTTVFPLTGEAAIPAGRVCVNVQQDEESIPGIKVLQAQFMTLIPRPT